MASLECNGIKCSELSVTHYFAQLLTFASFKQHAIRSNLLVPYRVLPFNKIILELTKHLPLQIPYFTLNCYISIAINERQVQINKTDIETSAIHTIKCI